MEQLPLSLVDDDGLQSVPKAPGVDKRVLNPDEIVADAIRRFREQAHAYRQLSASELAPRGQMTRIASAYLTVAERSLQHATALLAEYHKYLQSIAEGTGERAPEV